MKYLIVILLLNVSIYAKAQEETPIQEDPKREQLFWSGVYCRAQEARKAAYKELHTDKHYSKMGGAMAPRHRFLCQTVIRNNDHLLANLKPVINAEKISLLSCRDKTVKQIVSCLHERSTNMHRSDDEQVDETSCSDKLVEKISSEIQDDDDLINYIIQGRYDYLRRHEENEIYFSNKTIEKTFHEENIVEKDPKLLQLLWSSFYCSATKGILNGRAKIKEEYRYAKIGGFVDYDALHQHQLGIRIADKLIAEAKLAKHRLHIELLPCKNPIFIKIEDCLINRLFDEEDFVECKEPTMDALVEEMVRIRNEVQLSL